MKTIRFKYGYIEYVDMYPRSGINYPYIYKFVIYEKYRGKGYAKQLAKLLPKKCWLYALPITEKINKKGLKAKELISFYRSIGFKLKKGTKMNEMKR